MSVGLLYLVAKVYKPVPLEHVGVHASCLDLSGSVTLEQRYRIPAHAAAAAADANAGNMNENENKQEIIYAFPLDANAAVYSFTAQIQDGHEIKAIVRPKQVAKQIYKRATAAGKTAYLLEEHNRDVFKISLGNIPVGKAVTVKLSYVTELTLDSSADQMRFTVPTFVAPRYSLKPETPQLDQYSHVSKLSQGLDLQLEWNVTGKVLSVSSPSHPINTAVEAGSGAGFPSSVVRVEFGSKVDHLDKDVVILVRSEKLLAAQALLEKRDDSLCVALSMIPKLDLPNIKHAEFVFVVDNSGSMMGTKIEQTRAAMLLFLKSLPMDCRFNIVKFGSSFESWKPEAVGYGEETLQEACKFVSKIKADMGGTEILEPLKWIYNQDVHHRLIFLLTDGQVSQEDVVISLVKRYAGSTRCFALGIGDGCSRHLVQGVASAGNGISLFALENEFIGSKIAELLRVSLSPVVKCTALSLRNTSSSDLASKRIPSGSLSSPTDRLFTAYLLCEEFAIPGILPPFVVNVTLTAESKEFSYEVPVLAKPEAFDYSWIHALAARKLIGELEIEGAKDEVQKYAVKFNLSSSMTSFIAVDCADMTEFDVPELESGQELEEGCGRHFVGASLSASSTSQFALSAARAPRLRLSTKAARKSAPLKGAVLLLNSSDSGEEDSNLRKRSRSRSPTGAPSLKKRKHVSGARRFVDDEEEDEDDDEDEIGMDVGLQSADSTFLDIVTSQKFNGSYNLTPGLLNALHVTADTAKQAVGALHGISEEAWATAVVLEFLEIRFPDRRLDWKLMHDKSMSWLQSTIEDKELLATLLLKAKEFCSQHLNQ